MGRHRSFEQKRRRPRLRPSDGRCMPTPRIPFGPLVPTASPPTLPSLAPTELSSPALPKRIPVRKKPIRPSGLIEGHALLEERFWRKVARGVGCWLWLGQMTGSGGKTPEFAWRRRFLRARRVAWELEYGPVPEGYVVVPTCRNRRCVRPDHLAIIEKRDVHSFTYNDRPSASTADFGRTAGGQIVSRPVNSWHSLAASEVD